MHNVEKLQEIINSKIVKVHENGNSRTIEFENGETIQLQGEMEDIVVEQEKQIEHRCIFCGNEAQENDFLFTTNGESFICVKCTVLALETFLQNGATVDLNIGESFPDAIEQINKMSENLDR